ncbi:UNVERIFIED_CONTAM: hypothetical protein Slati_3795300 [Sesamum latifolium]|uniref:Uncharacterized protein n=1 Tax=Sesamum latifolium TaxID=2727402 RepID=A0AAW2U3W4_9LAMI
MATFLPFTSITPQTSHLKRRQVVHRPRFHAKIPTSNPSTKNPESQPENVLLKIAWYGSEFLGVAASLLRSPSKTGDGAGPSSELSLDGFGRIDRAAVVESIKEDFQRSYFVTGNLAVDAYEEDCEFADPAGSFRGLSRFKRNCTNFGYLLEQSDMKLMKWEDFEDKGIGHWRFICVMSFPWKPILSGIPCMFFMFGSWILQPPAIQSISLMKNLEKYAGGSVASNPAQRNEDIKCDPLDGMVLVSDKSKGVDRYDFLPILRSITQRLNQSLAA